MNKKILNKVFEEQKIDVIISTSEQTRLWYSKISASAGIMFIEKDKATLFLDGRYIEHGMKNAKNVEVKLMSNKNEVKSFVNKNQYNKIGIESNYETLDGFENIKKLFPNAEFININGQELRIIKTDEEAENIAKAGALALEALEKVKHMIKPGTKESDLDAELEKQIRLLDAEKGSFDAIVASGVRSALPHGRASNKIMEDGELVTIDFGAIYKGYCSDITRTFHVGTVTDPELLNIETILREAQKMGIEAVKPGVTTKDIDQVCRNYITEKGYGENFVHSTGHGLGIDVHELPNVTSNPEFSRTLEEGMVITVEPGIYIEGFGGIRVEDDILVTKDGHRILSTRNE